MSCWMNITCPQQKQHTGTTVCQAKTHLLEPLNSTSLAAKGKDKLQKINDWYLNMYGKWNPSANHHFCGFQAFVFKALSLPLPWNCCFYKCWHLWLANVRGPSRTIFHHVLSSDAISWFIATHPLVSQNKKFPSFTVDSSILTILRSTLSYEFMTFHLSFFTEVAVEAPPTFDGVMLYHVGIPPIHLENTLPPRCGSESLGICHWFSPPSTPPEAEDVWTWKRFTKRFTKTQWENHGNTMMQPRGTPWNTGVLKTEGGGVMPMETNI